MRQNRNTTTAVSFTERFVGFKLAQCVARITLTRVHTFGMLPQIRASASSTTWASLATVFDTSLLAIGLH
jgi:hypothetical protein